MGEITECPVLHVVSCATMYW